MTEPTLTDAERVAALRAENAQLRQANEHLRRELDRLRGLNTDTTNREEGTSS